MFPTRDQIDGLERLFERDHVHQLLLEAVAEIGEEGALREHPQG